MNSSSQVEQQILTLPHLKDCPPNRDARWLCRWCKSMNCRERQESLANLYLKNQAFTDFHQSTLNERKSVYSIVTVAFT
jgi:hypothetical protein